MTSHFLSSIGTFRNGSRQGMQTGAIRSVLELKTHEGDLRRDGGPSEQRTDSHHSSRPQPPRRSARSTQRERGARPPRHSTGAPGNSRQTKSGTRQTESGTRKSKRDSPRPASRAGPRARAVPVCAASRPRFLIWELDSCFGIWAFTLRASRSRTRGTSRRSQLQSFRVYGGELPESADHGAARVGVPRRASPRRLLRPPRPSTSPCRGPRAPERRPSPRLGRPLLTLLGLMPAPREA